MSYPQEIRWWDFLDPKEAQAIQRYKNSEKQGSFPVNAQEQADQEISKPQELPY